MKYAQKRTRQTSAWCTLAQCKAQGAWEGEGESTGHARRIPQGSNSKKEEEGTLPSAHPEYHGERENRRGAIQVALMRFFASALSATSTNSQGGRRRSSALQRDHREQPQKSHKHGKTPWNPGNSNMDGHASGQRSVGSKDKVWAHPCASNRTLLRTSVGFKLQHGPGQGTQGKEWRGEKGVIPELS